MTNFRTEFDGRSFVCESLLALVGRSDETQTNRIRAAMVAVGLATALLSAFAATSAVVRDPRLWWAALPIGMVGVTSLTFVAGLAFGRVPAPAET